ncbi:helix-turn-helix transcriptional regulator [uncultured Ruminococcus sp.]|uniref:helix-turn-helix domain-containing protein n=1 Tax=uncultured Ruminococcus sp. TaxID=165186 RepID=UPI0025F7088B|nr:helix-turn-helix transcriptional regulator [uncultured Ruminococcus sp.]
MTVSEAIKTILKEKNITLTDFAKLIGITKQNLSNKLSRDNFTSQELYTMVKALNVDVIISDENGKEYKIGYTPQQLADAEQKRKQTTNKMKEKAINE